MKKIIIALACFVFLFNVVAIPVALAQGGDFLGINYQKNSGLGSQDPRETVAQLIKVVMGFLGTVAVVIILLGGFKWMTAGGAQDKVDEARKLITAGIIGVGIILSAWGIAVFVLNQLMSATSGG